MKNIYIVFSFLLFASLNIQAQDEEKEKVVDPAQMYGDGISMEDLEKHLTIIASDEYQGRDTGEKGQKMAAEYIANHFKALGLKPGNPKTGTYFQEVPLQEGGWGEASITIDGKTYELFKDFYGFPSSTSPLKTTTSNLVFAGYGIDDSKYSDYKLTDVKGKIMVVYDGEPMKANGDYLITDSSTPSEWTENWRMKMETAKEKGAEALLVVDPELKRNVVRFRPYLSGGGMKLQDGGEGDFINTFYISQDLFEDLFPAKKIEKRVKKMAKTGFIKSLNSKKTAKFDINKETRKFNSENVLGLLEGTDLKDEILVITAHYDHVGTKGDKIFNGADDDGSGTVSVLELAEAFAEAKAAGNGPRRSILFMTVTGEEKGLLGSEFYVTNPLYPLEQTVADLNIDMVGRTDDLHDESSRNYVYIIGSDKLSTELHAINEEANKNYTEMNLDYKYNDPEDPNRFYYRSDHYNFAKNNIPIIFYFNGTHEDYHQDTDTVDKIEFDMLMKRARLVFYTAWQLVNQDKRIEVDVFEEE